MTVTLVPSSSVPSSELALEERDGRIRLQLAAALEELDQPNAALYRVLRHLRAALLLLGYEVRK